MLHATVDFAQAKVMNIVELKADDRPAVDALMRRDSKTVGFLPNAALDDYLKRGGALGAKTPDGGLAGYLLFAAHFNHFRIAQLCVSPPCRGRGVARQLLDALKNVSNGRKYITLTCRHDFPATDVWPRMGFVPLREKAARSGAGHRLVQWYLQLAPDDQLDMFQEKIYDDALAVAVDAQVVFNFDEPESDKSIPSKSLYTDCSNNVLRLQVTDEIFNEINRNSDPDRRETSRRAAQTLVVLWRNGLPLEHFTNRLRQILPGKGDSYDSDILHLAIVAASDTDIFVTEDRRIIKKASDIMRAVGVEVISPTDLIIRLHERANAEAYPSRRISGSDLEWRRLTAAELRRFPVSKFTGGTQKEGVLREQFHALLSNQEKHTCDVLYLRNEIAAYRVVEATCDRSRTLLMGGVAPTLDRALIASFLVADTVRRTIRHGASAVIAFPDKLQPELLAACHEVGFRNCGNRFLRVCIANTLTGEEVLKEIARHCPKYRDDLSSIPNHELERRCSPLHLQSPTDSGKYFLVPIQPGYAMSLFDESRAAGDLFGGAPAKLMRWDNVYYRKKTRHKMLRSPSRVLWYVTDKQKSVVAVSHLDEVAVGNPRLLFKKYQKKGILNWNDLYKMCDRDPSNEIMALRFSHTFLFSNPVAWSDVSRFLENADVKPSLPSPMKIPADVFRHIYRLGFGCHS